MAVILPDAEAMKETVHLLSVSDAYMDANETLQFEQDLESLLLEAFATGATVEGTWELADSSETIPTWTIEITKTAEADTRYDPEVIE